MADRTELDQLETLDASASTPDVRGAREAGGIAVGDQVGKYTLGRRIGRGGMGVVYLARDERLGREVAIKLAHVTGVGSLGRAEREAQALAKLSHPNVVVVYEVGEHAGHLFVVMEYVTGGTARTWLAERPRTWREIVTLYAGAGAGLGAAHAAGIVHRDFKPDNVLVGGDGRPRVADFGLALAPGSAAAGGISEPGSPVSARLTTTGAVVGTPAYMAPEQIAGAGADERADQFAFCVALWEALYGARPFTGKTLDELVAALREPPRATAVKLPRHVVAALRRGLAIDPAARWPSMAVLLAALGREYRRERFAIGAAVGAVAIGAIVATVALHGGDPCAGPGVELASIWNPSRAIAIHATFVAAGGGDSWPGVAGAIDRYADAWADAELGACRAARAGSQSAQLLDARSACIYRARSRFGAVADALASADRAGVASAPEQVRQLPDLADCASSDRYVPLVPSDPRQLFRAATIEAAWLAIEAEVAAHVPQPHGELDALAEATRGLEHTSVGALAVAIRGRTEEALGDASAARADFEAATQAYVELGDERNAAMLMTDMADSYLDAGQLEAATHWVRLAGGLAHHLGDPADLGSEIAGLQARALERGPHMRDAAPLRRRQAELSRQVRRGVIDEIIQQEDLAFAAHDEDDTVAMNREVGIGMGLVERNLGVEHPAMIRFESFRTMSAMREGKLDEAERSSRHAVALAEKWYGPESGDAVDALMNLSAILQRRGDLAGSMAATQRALVAARKRDADSDTVGHLEGNLGIAYASMGDLATAAPHLERASEVVERLLGADAEPLDDLYVARAYVARGLGQLEASRQLLVRATAIADKADVGRVNPRIELSYTLVPMHRAAEAVKELDAVGPIAASAATEPRIAAEYHLALAKALAQLAQLGQPGARERAVAEATRSRDAFAALGPDFAPQRDEAAAFRDGVH